MIGKDDVITPPNLLATRRALNLALVAFVAACAGSNPKPAPSTSTTDMNLAPTPPPPLPREFRAAWVATVANIDWPSRNDLTSAQQQDEILTILDRAQSLNLNAIILQVRTSADALYASLIEPWSEYLTGTQGKAPAPYYDPLDYWIKAAHERGMELHAWFNPYRARQSSAVSPNAANHISNRIPHTVKTYGNQLWMDPGEGQASQQTLDVIMDVVRRYNIDGVHIDDYFYPYPVTAQSTRGPTVTPATPVTPVDLPFPDDPSWQRYQDAGGTLSRDDWRRDNVNRLVEQIYTHIKREKAYVKFGVSPFGIGKPSKRPAGIIGFSQYDRLYADAELWLNKGWLDYFTPQLYWPINQPAQAFGTLLDYWAGENSAGRHLWPGMYSTRILPAGANGISWEPQEIVNQINLTRGRTISQPRTSGHVHFSMVGLTQNRRGLSDDLTPLYAQSALVPASPWLNDGKPLADLTLVVARDKDAAEKRVVRSVPRRSKRFANIARFAAWSFHDGTWRLTIHPVKTNQLGSQYFELSYQRRADLPEGETDNELEFPQAVFVAAIDRFGHQGRYAMVTRAMLENAPLNS
jgi:uncharacterized lipoprotein YddW (UPF0748 family)